MRSFGCSEFVSANREMSFLREDTIALALIFVVPGFVALKVFDVLVPSERRDWAGHVLEAFSYSAINLALWFWLIDLLRDADPMAQYAGMAFVLLVSPACLGAAANALLRWDRLRGLVRHPTPTAWDHFFGRGQECWILFHMRSGARVGARYGPGSFAGSYPHPRDVYASEVWRIDDGGAFIEKVEQTDGILVSFENCEMIEFFSLARSANSRQTEMR